MKILNIDVNWNRTYDNRPTFDVTIDKFPEFDVLRYKNVGSLYLAEKEGYVSFYHYDKPGDGFAGRKFDIILEDGTPKSLIGPWSSRAGAMNTVNEFPVVLDCSYLETEGRYKNLKYSGAITLEAILQNYKGKVAAVISHSEITFEPIDSDGELKARSVNGMKRKIDTQMLGIVTSIEEARQYLINSNKKIDSDISSEQFGVVM